MGQNVIAYLSQPALLKALGVVSNITKWESCSGAVYQAIAGPDWFNQESYTIPVLLDEYRVMIYNGMNDWICNHQGNYHWVTEMQWNHQGEFNNAPHNVWSSVDGKTVKGYNQKHGNLEFTWVVGAGHMVRLLSSYSSYSSYSYFSYSYSCYSSSFLVTCVQVPHDKPQEAWELMNNFITNTAFQTPPTKK